MVILNFLILAQMAEREELENLRIQLEAFKLTQQISDIPDITNIIKQITLNYIEKSLNATMDVVAIKRQLDEVYNDSLISLELYEWALTEVNNKNGANPDSKPSACKCIIIILSSSLFKMCNLIFYMIVYTIILYTYILDPFINVEPVTDQLLGDSTNGRVHLVVDKKGNKFAAKRFLRAHCKEFTSEFKLLALLRHKNIVQYVGLAQLHPNENPAVVMELMKEDLHKRIMCQSPIVVSKKMHILQDVAEGLYYLHSYKPVIIHRDLTAKNVLLNSTGVAKISDFGNSRMVDQEQLSMMTSLAGTLVYLAPEAQGSEYDEKIDIFSYGHMMLFVFVEEFPNELLSPSYYEVDPRSRTQILKVRPETDRREKYIIKLIDTFVIDLVKKCLSNKPEDRPTAFQLLNHFKSCRDRDNSV